LQELKFDPDTETQKTERFKLLWGN
jgi:hypothetical protein